METRELMMAFTFGKDLAKTAEGLMVSGRKRNKVTNAGTVKDNATTIQKKVLSLIQGLFSVFIFQILYIVFDSTN